MNVLLSINPEFAEKILSGQKEYEFRKTPIRKADTVDKVILYASSPVQRIVGTFKIYQIVSGSPKELWERYGGKSGIDCQQRFMQYYRGKQEGYAIEIRDPHRLPIRIDPTEYINEFTPPVSFQYVSEEFGSSFALDPSKPAAASD
jgi:predicted transcriptional regulator